MEKEIEKLLLTIRKQVRGYGLPRYSRILRNQANNIDNSIKKGKLEKALAQIICLEMLCSFGTHLLKEELQKHEGNHS
jgi:hypothetical protein